MSSLDKHSRELSGQTPTGHTPAIYPATPLPHPISSATSPGPHRNLVPRTPPCTTPPHPSLPTTRHRHGPPTPWLVRRPLRQG